MKNKLWNRCLKVYEVIEKVPSLTILTGLKSQDFLCQLSQLVPPKKFLLEEEIPSGPKLMIFWPYRKSFK